MCLCIRLKRETPSVIPTLLFRKGAVLLRNHTAHWNKKLYSIQGVSLQSESNATIETDWAPLNNLHIFLLLVSHNQNSLLHKKMYSYVLVLS